MPILAIMLAWGRYGPQPYSGPIVIWMIAGIMIFALISGIVNRKKLDQINKDATKKKEPPKIVGKSWKCPKCGEMSEPQFDTCWKCGEARKDEHAA
jgi:hypothetical protein